LLAKKYCSRQNKSERLFFIKQMNIEINELALLYGKPDECPGPYRVVHKLPALPVTLKNPIEIDNVVAETLVDHPDFLQDIAHLTANALVQVHGSDTEFSETQIRGVAGQISTSLAVALLRSHVLEGAIHNAIAEQTSFGQGYLACPE
jgi:hypothetical protein